MTNVNNMVLPVFQTVLLITILVLVILTYTKTHQGFQNREGFGIGYRWGASEYGRGNGNSGPITTTVVSSGGPKATQH